MEGEIKVQIRKARSNETKITKWPPQAIVGQLENHGFNQQIAGHIRAIICDSKQCVSVTAQNEKCRLTLSNSNFSKPHRLGRPSLDPTPIAITVHIAPKSEKGKGRSYRSQFPSEKWKPIDLFEAIEGCGFDNKEVWQVIEFMRDCKEIIKFKMENEEYLLTISDFSNPPRHIMLNN